LPLRVVTAGVGAASALAETTVRGTAAATAAVQTTASAAVDIAAMPVREGIKAVWSQAFGTTLSRHSWCGDRRAWIEVRGLDGVNGAELGASVLDAVRGHPGVTSARVNRPLSRVVVETNDDQVSLRDLYSVVDEAEKHWRQANDAGSGSARVHSLPGDGLLQATTAAMVGANAAGLGIAVIGRVLRLPRAPITVKAAAAIANYQPWVHRLLANRVGAETADTVLSAATTVANIVTLSPATLAVDVMIQALNADEQRAQAQAWTRHEPQFARYAEHLDVRWSPRPVPPPAGPTERHGKRIAYAQAISAGLVGAITRNVGMAATAALAASPKAMRTTCDSFAATLGRGLANQDAVLPLRPASLRRLDNIDALLIDPRALFGEQLQVVQVRGVGDDERSAVFDRAQKLLEKPGTGPGWHRLPGRRTRGPEALLMPARHPLASAVVAEARKSGAELASVDIDILGELRAAFEHLSPVPGSASDNPTPGGVIDDGGIDGALAESVSDLQQKGCTVAVLSSTGAQALSSADVALGLMSDTGSTPPWNADLLVFGLAGAWQLLHALPAARAASRRGIALSTSASALGGLLMVPGVRGGRGPGSVTIGAAAGVFSGYLLARRTVRTPAPTPAPVYEWHAMSIEQVRDVLPEPERETQAGVSAAPSTTGRYATAVWHFITAVGAELSDDPLTPVLAVCSVATALLGSPTDAVLVGAVLTGNAMLATAQRLHAENRLNRLLAQQVPPARKTETSPNGTRSYSEVASEQLRPGEVIEVRSNEVVPADARIIDERDLEVDESSLTGESLSVEKQVAATPGAELADRRCMLYSGTTVVAGTAVALVTAVGADTQARRAIELSSGDLPAVGLQHQLSQLMSRAFPASAAGGALVGALGLLRGGTLQQALSNAIALAVSAIPEGMPLMATLTQQATAHRLGKSGALVRVPRSVEALGRVDVACFDKTGTLSENRLRVAQIHPLPDYSRDDVLRCAVYAAPAANGAAQAHATDHAIIEAAAAVDGSGPTPESDAYLPFRSGRSFSASVSDGQLTVKGAPEVVLAACNDIEANADQAVAELAAGGLRVIAVAQRQLDAKQTETIRTDPDRIGEFCRAELSLTGFLGLADTPRPQARQLLADLGDHGMAIRLITGDHPVTASAIAEELGMTATADQVITGTEWNTLSRKQQEHVVSERTIYARMSPENKVQIVQTLERAGWSCAMVGDGANDAAAIRAATVGLGVVAHGSDAAHTTADVVLTDGRIETLVDAIEEGRRLWQAVQVAVAGLLGGNAGEVIFGVIGSALTGNSPLNTRQLLLLNMLTDALPATAVAVSTPNRPVQRADRGLDERALLRAVALRGGIVAAAATTAWTTAKFTGLPQRASTVALIALVATELGQTLVDSHAPLVVLTTAGSLAALMLMTSTPGLSQLLGCTPVGPIGWTQALGTAAAATLAIAATSHLTSKQSSPETPVTTIDSPAVAARLSA
jgi:magnesium-transporting ATPase (P-type)